MHQTHMSHKHTHTLQQIFQHPTSHNLEWHDVVALIKQSGTVHEEENGHLTFTLNGVAQIFHPTRDKKDVSDVQQVLDIRHFLEKAGFHKDGTIAPPGPAPLQESASEHGHDNGSVDTEHNRRAEQ